MYTLKTQAWVAGILAKAPIRRACLAAYRLRKACESGTEIIIDMRVHSASGSSGYVWPAR
jgi:hypothetical protein